MTKFRGTYTAIVTPFRDDAIDEAALAKLVEAQIAGGVSGIVAVGTTGESPTLTPDEHNEVVAKVVDAAAGRCQVIAGTGSNSTREAIALTTHAEKAGADAALLVAPYYNKPSPAGLLAHFRAIAESTSLPIMLYSIPGRCGIEISVETTARLAETCPNIVSIKEAGGSVERISQLRQALPDEFAILSGDDSLTLPFISVGAAGVISVATNLIPAAVAEMVTKALSGDMAGAEALHRKYYNLFKYLLGLEPNPVGIKFALARRGDIAEELRLPLVPASEASRAKIAETLEALGL